MLVLALVRKGESQNEFTTSSYKLDWKCLKSHHQHALLLLCMKIKFARCWSTRILCYYPKYRGFGRRGFASRAKQGRGSFPAALNSAAKGLWRVRAKHQSQFLKKREEGKDKKESKQAGRINLNCNKIIVCIEISTFGIDFFNQTKGWDFSCWNTDLFFNLF